MQKKWAGIESMRTGIKDAIKYICDKNMGVDKHVSILICGSLYLAGQALKENGVSI